MYIYTFCVISDVNFLKNRAAYMQLHKNHLLVQEMDWPKSESKQVLCMIMCISISTVQQYQIYHMSIT